MSAPDELSLQAWILTGNALTVLPPAIPNNDLRRRLDALHTQLETLPPELILSALESLPQEDRELLLALCEKALDVFGAEAEERLGIEANAAEPVLEFLRRSQRG